MAGGLVDSSCHGRTRRRRLRPPVVDRQGATQYIAQTPRPVADLDIVVVSSRFARCEWRLDFLVVSGATRIEVEGERRAAVLGAPAVPLNPCAFGAHDVLCGGIESKLRIDRTARLRGRRNES